jgi:hypothetical protein
MKQQAGRSALRNMSISSAIILVGLSALTAASTSAKAETFLATFFGNFTNPSVDVCLSRAKAALHSNGLTLTRSHKFSQFLAAAFGNLSNTYKISVSCGHAGEETFLTVSVAGPNLDKAAAIDKDVVLTIQPNAPVP